MEVWRLHCLLMHIIYSQFLSFSDSQTEFRRVFNEWHKSALQAKTGTEALDLSLYNMLAPSSQASIIQINILGSTLSAMIQHSFYNFVMLYSSKNTHHLFLVRLLMGLIGYRSI